MRIILTYILIVFLAIPFYGQQVNQVQQSRNKAQQAAIFYRDNEFEKARDLYLELYKDTRLSHYFENYINSLVSLKEYEEAEKALRKEIRGNNNLNLEITLGYVYKEMGDLQRSSDTFNKVLDKLPANQGIIINIGNTFFNRREYEFAEKTYIKGRMLIPGEMFRNNLASIYSFMRDYERMMAEYLEMVKEDESEVQRIQARVNSLLRFDFDNSLRNTFKREIIKAIQNNPNTIAYNRLLIWMFVTEKNYEQALNNTIALDRRTKEEDANILSFARGAAQEELFDVALSGLKYLSNRAPKATNFEDVAREIVNIEFQKYTSMPVSIRPPAKEMYLLFRELINEQGYTKSTISILKNYAHFLSFYQGKPDLAYEVIKKALGISGLGNNERSILRIEMADTYVFDNKLWEASLLYSRIAESNQGNAFADDVKLKRAKLSFYLGDIEWAKIQLDALKASTSKLIANDAMELSLLIATYYDMDTIAEPVQMFARGDLLLFQNRDSLAYTVFDSVATQYPYNIINDMVLMRKAAIRKKEYNFEQAATYYRDIVENFSSSNSADVALYNLALLYEQKLGMPNEAQVKYRKVMTNYPGSIYTNDSRNRYRKLRGDFNKEETITPYESENYYSRPE